MTNDQILSKISSLDPAIGELTAAELVPILAPLTARDILTADVRRYFRETAIWYLSGTQQMAGAFQVAIDYGELPVELLAALGELYSSVFGGSADTLSTSTSPAIAARLFAGWEALVGSGVITADQRDGFYKLGGGRPFESITSNDIAEARSEAELAEALAAAQVNLQIQFDQLWNEFVSESMGNADAAGVAAGLREMADQIEGD